MGSYFRLKSRRHCLAHCEQAFQLLLNLKMSYFFLFFLTITLRKSRENYVSKVRLLKVSEVLSYTAYFFLRDYRRISWDKIYPNQALNEAANVFETAIKTRNNQLGSDDASRRNKDRFYSWVLYNRYREMAHLPKFIFLICGVIFWTGCLVLLVGSIYNLTC